MAMVIAVSVLISPTRRLMAQSRDMAVAEQQLVEVKSENRRLSERVSALSSDSLIEMEARERFGRVYPGDESYSVPESGPIELHLPEVWPFTRVDEALREAAAG
ncbi:MAG: septum formation initiator family protein [Microthrixaceae bacterium]|nr:septum formation initiator family protein [Microthrixaceae bacterium]